tara:strand:+ start:24158 stop:24805 length:648 start_codon:yes stop_codon:yes gene_type:complete
MNQIVKKTEYLHAVEIHALRPGMTIKEIADECGVSEMTIASWRRNPAFVDLVYERYMVEFGSELPAVLKAMVREAKAGNVQAGRLVLEHSGKLVKNVNVTIDSPFEKFLQADKTEVEYQDAEIQDIVEDIPEPQDIVLPERNKEDQKKRTTSEFARMKDVIANRKRKKTVNNMYQWKKRAKAVGVDLLPAGRPTKTVLEDWKKKVMQAEMDRIGE